MSSSRLTKWLRHFNPQLLPYWLALLPLFTFLIHLYVQSWWLSFLFTLPATYFPARTLLRFRMARQEQINRRLFGHFLQILSSQLASGTTFLRAFIKANQELAEVADQGGKLLLELRLAAQAIEGQASPALVLRHTAQRLPCPEAKPILDMFAAQVAIGGDVTPLTKFAEQMIHDLNETEDSVLAETSKQTLEAFILAALPYAITACMKWSAATYYAQAYASTLGQLILFMAFCLACFASSMTFYVTSTRFQALGALKVEAELPWAQALVRLPMLHAFGLALLKRLPPALALQWKGVHRQLGMKGAHDPALRHQQMVDQLALLPLLFLASLAFGGLLAFKNVAYLMLGPGFGLLICLLWLNRPLVQAKRCRESLILSFPFFCGMTCALLQSGFVPQRAMETCVRLLDEGETVMGRTLKQLAPRMQKGESLRTLLSSLAVEAQVPEIQAALNLMNQYAVTGNGQTLTLLTVQVGVCWNLAKHQLRRKQEAQSIQILIPMMLNLLAILLSALAPVLTTLTSYL